MLYVRFEATEPGPSARHTGVFGLANGLAHRGLLTEDDDAWLRANIHWLDEAYTDPGLVNPTLFDKSIYPFAACWFKINDASRPLVARLQGHLDLLDRYGVSWRRRQAATLGKILFEDPVQVVSDGQPR